MTKNDKNNNNAKKNAQEAPTNRKVGSFLGNSVSCFLIETKFIFKLLRKFRRQN